MVDVVPNSNGFDFRDEALRPGTSVFITEMNRVIWILEINEETITVQSVDDTHEVDRELFEQYIEAGKVCIEAQPRP